MKATNGRRRSDRMITDLKPYPVYRDSGVLWLDVLPADWDAGTLRRRLKARDGIKIGPFGSQLKLEYMTYSGYKVYGQGNVIAHDFTNGTKFVDDQKYRELSACEVCPGDLLLTMMGSSGHCAMVPDSAAAGIMDSHLLRLRPDVGRLDGRFAALILDRAPYVKEQIAVAGKGSIMQGLNSSLVKDLVLAFPPLPDQAAIVRFLHHADQRIRRYILNKQKLIKLLGEQKRTIIHRAVTCGLDLNVRLKPSGVEWLGDIPDHWQVPLLGQCLNAIEQGWSPTAAEGEVADGQWAVLTLSAVKHGRFDPAAIKPIPLSADVSDSIQVNVGDLLLTRSNTRTLVGDACVVDQVGQRVIFSDLIYRLKVNHKRFHPRFLMYLLLSSSGRRQIERDARGSSGTMPKIAQTHIRSWRVVLPPIEEQLLIVESIERESETLVRAIQRAESEIALLREYQTRLIADVVTGKLDVREAAANLPDEAEEAEELLPDEEVLVGEEELTSEELAVEEVVG